MKKHSVPVFVAVLAAVALFASTAAAQSPPAPSPAMKIAVVDLQRAVEQTEDGLRAVSTIKKLFESRQQDLGRREGELLKKKEELDKKKKDKAISQGDYDKNLDDLKRQLMELQQMSQDYDRELYKKRKELTDPILERVLASIKRIANQEGYDLVLDKPSAVFVRSDLDLTDRVIQLANSTGPNQGAPPPPKGGAAPTPPPAAPKK